MLVFGVDVPLNEFRGDHEEIGEEVDFESFIDPSAECYRITW